MPDLHTIKDLFRHMQWADATVWSRVLSNPAASEDEKLRASLYHLHLVQRAFLKMWRSESFDVPFPQFDTMQSVYEWSRGYYEEAREFLESLSDADLQRPIVNPWTDIIAKQIGRTPAAVSLGETALQVVMHSTHHRGQVNAHLRSLGGEPPTVDYITWLWLDRPE
jgi:uncharacterized damage-inducible protein DinB